MRQVAKLIKKAFLTDKFGRYWIKSDQAVMQCSKSVPDRQTGQACHLLCRCTIWKLFQSLGLNSAANSLSLVGVNYLTLFISSTILWLYKLFFYCWKGCSLSKLEATKCYFIFSAGKRSTSAPGVDAGARGQAWTSQFWVVPVAVTRWILTHTLSVWGKASSQSYEYYVPYLRCSNQT